MLTPAQLRAGRALVGWSRAKLADATVVHANTVKDFEINGSDPKGSTLDKWQRALETAGVAFIDDDGQAGPGVRLRGSTTTTKRILKGKASS